MKNSYYQTPRTLQDAVFIVSADPIQTFSAPTRGMGAVFAVVITVLSLATLTMLFV